MRHFFVIAFFVVSFPVWACADDDSGTDNSSVARCHTTNADFSLYAPTGAALIDGASLTVVSSVVAPSTGLNLSTMGVYRSSLKRIDLPSYWRPQGIAFSDCDWRHSSSLGFALTPRTISDIPMYIQTYFTSEMPGPDADLEQMIRDGDAFPVKLHIICSIDQSAPPSPLGCEKVRILDKIIPVDPANASAIRSTTSTVLPIESSLCADPVTTIRSSGAVVNWRDKTYILASSSAAMSTYGAGSCTDVVLPDGQRSHLQLLQHDYANGLALFAVPEKLGLKGVQLKAMNPDDLPDSADLVGIGKSTTTAARVQMELLVDSSQRHFIPRLKSAIEVLGGNVDSGWMGAPLVDGTGNILGIASQEYLRIFPGSLTRPMRWQPTEGETSNHLVVIPASAIVDWLEHLGNTDSKIWVLNGAQANAPLQIQSGSLVFTEDCPPLDPSQPVGQYPIGGQDPVGVGGDSSNYRACKIGVTLGSSIDNRFFAPQQQAWAEGLENLLKAGNRVELDYHVWRSDAGLERAYFYSTESFFQELGALAAGHAVVAIVRTPGATAPGLDPRLHALRSRAADVAERARSVYLNNSFGDSTIELLLRKVYLLGAMLASEQWRLVQEKDFTELLDESGPYAQSWGVVHIVFGGVGLQQSIPLLQQEWRKAQ